MGPLWVEEGCSISGGIMLMAMGSRRGGGLLLPLLLFGKWCEAEEDGGGSPSLLSGRLPATVRH